jgi:hypothetical protein
MILSYHDIELLIEFDEEVDIIFIQFTIIPELMMRYKRFFHLVTRYKNCFYNYGEEEEKIICLVITKFSHKKEENLFPDINDNNMKRLTNIDLLTESSFETINIEKTDEEISILSFVSEKLNKELKLTFRHHIYNC